MSCTIYWKGWFRWRFMLIVVCHFVIISLSFFNWWIMTISLVSTNYSYISSVRISRSGIGDLSQVWLPWLDIGDLRQVLQFWLDIGDLSQVWLPWLDIGDRSQGWLPWLDILIFLIPRILVLLTFSVPTQGYCRNAYMVCLFLWLFALLILKKVLGTVYNFY
jgi:hypothetical protein